MPPPYFFLTKDTLMSHAMDSTSLVGTTGALLTFSVSYINGIVSLGIGLVTLVYMVIKTINEIKKGKSNAIQQPDADKE